MNRKALRAVADVIEYADRFFLGAWIGTPIETPHGPRMVDTVDLDRSAATLWDSCDTVGCFAGWTNAWADNPRADDWIAAAKELGLTQRQGGQLFLGWEDFYQRADVKAALGGIDPWALDSSDGDAAAKLLRAIASGDVKFY